MRVGGRVIAAVVFVFLHAFGAGEDGAPSMFAECESNPTTDSTVRKPKEDKSNIIYTHTKSTKKSLKESTKISPREWKTLRSSVKAKPPIQWPVGKPKCQAKMYTDAPLSYTRRIVEHRKTTTRDQAITSPTGGKRKRGRNRQALAP